MFKGKKCRIRLGWKFGARLWRASNRRLRKLDFILQAVRRYWGFLKQGSNMIRAELQEN